MMHQSIATIESPEFINLQPLELNPLMSSCEIKVLYLGENRNHSYINKEVATEMAKTLRGAPIVGYYKEDNEDFRDHGQKMILDGDGIKFECQTKPYGFVSPDAKVWFQKFKDKDDFGNEIEREYLMTTGYLWTGQFEECKLPIAEGRPQSMELDENTLDGHWSTNNKTGMDFFIINDAIFSKLCILGEDVEPCFEGASITAPQVSTSFSKMNDEFKQTLFSMMQDLKKFALRGGENMEVVTENNVEVTETTVETAENIENSNIEKNATETEVVAETFAKKDDEKKKEEENSDSDSNKEKEDNKSNEDEQSEEDKKKEKAKNTCKEDEDKKKTNHSLDAEFTKLQNAYTELETKYQELVEFKKQIEDERKDALIDSFYMLSDEDKKDVIENKSKYSLEEIEAKLSIICVRNKVKFDLDDNDKNDNKIENEETKDVVTYNLNNSETTIPAWISAIKNTRDSKNN